MTAWAQLFHFYQPPTQTHEILHRVAEESYRPLLAVLHEHPDARAAVNINAVLAEALADHGLGDILDSLRQLAQRGQVEFTGSGRYHPVLPLIPAGERARSIAENARENRRLLGAAWQPRGFFPPEMCFSPEIVPAVAGAGYKWIILSGVACASAWPTREVYSLGAGGDSPRVLFRDDVRSNRVSFAQTGPEAFIDDLAGISGGEESYVVTAMDAETFGHHVRGWERDFLAATYHRLEHGQRAENAASRVRMLLPSEVVDEFPGGPVTAPLTSSWSTTDNDIAAKNPFPLWHAPGNRLHHLQWEYVGHCAELVALADRYAQSGEARKAADFAGERFQPALHSCQFWWASRRPMWDVTMVHRGFLLLNEVLLQALRAIHLGSAPEAVKAEAARHAVEAGETRSELEGLLIADGAG